VRDRKPQSHCGRSTPCAEPLERQPGRRRLGGLAVHAQVSFVVDGAGKNFDKIFELAVEGGADDVSEDDGEIEIVGPVEAFKTLSDQLSGAKIEVREAGLRMEANQEMELDNIEKTLQVMRAIEALEELDDVQNVYSNLRITEEAMAAMES